MGEIADMMLDGTLCEGCGEYIGFDSGFPGYCSQQCARDRGASHYGPNFREVQAERPKLPWFRVYDEKGVKRVAAFVRKHDCNTYNPKTDKNGNHIALIGWDDRPDSDWGRFKGHRCAIWCKTPELWALAEPEIAKGLRR